MFRRRTVHEEGSQLEIRSDRHRDVHVVQLFGELDINNAAAFDAEIKRVERSDARKIIVDLSGLTFITAEGLKVVIHASARSRKHDNRLRLLHGPAQVQQACETTGLLSRLPFDEDHTLESDWHQQPRDGSREA